MRKRFRQYVQDRMIEEGLWFTDSLLTKPKPPKVTKPKPSVHQPGKFLAIKPHPPDARLGKVSSLSGRLGHAC